jgi:hypothetical protein
VPSEGSKSSIQELELSCSNSSLKELSWSKQLFRSELGMNLCTPIANIYRDKRIETIIAGFIRSELDGSNLDKHQCRSLLFYVWYWKQNIWDRIGIVSWLENDSLQNSMGFKTQ